MSYFSFQWHITEECDQRCKHCYIYALGSHAKFKSTSESQMDRILSNIETFAEKSNRTPYIYLTGGDPVLHPQFWNLLEKIHTKGFRTAILGNPFHVTAETAGKMAVLGVVKYQLSLDGLKDTHDRIRQAGSYDATMEKIPVLQSAGLQVAIMATVSKWNVKEIPLLIDEVVKANADIFAFARYCPSVKDREVCCSPQEYREMLAACDKQFKKYEGGNTYFSKKEHLWTLFDYENGRFDPDSYPDDEIVYGGCNCGNAHFTILSDGACYACRRMQSNVGNALTDDLYDLFTGEKMDRYRVYEKFEKCSKCPLLRFCRGCPAVAFGYSGGNMYAPDPQCWYGVK
ncbi:MAG: radical SAM/SPASM domain protein, ACGX system [Clostridia bacterium]|nr:radical SAM/SPASM domain protein, ACGX system [Clostridia bacterium]